MSNIQKFVPSLFSSSVRSLSNVEQAIQSSQLVYSFADENSRNMILQAWLAAWQKGQGSPYDAKAFSQCPSPDVDLLDFLAAYIKKNPSLGLCVPSLTRTSFRIDPSNYKYT